MPDSSNTLGEAPDTEARRVALSLSVSEAHAARIAATLTGAMAELRQQPCVETFEFSEKPDGTTRRFRIALGVRDMAESDANPLDGLAAEMGADPHVTASTAQCRAKPANPAPPAQKVPAFWKRWTVSMIAVYPALIGLVYGLSPVTANMPKPISLFIVALLLTGLNARYLVPFLNRHLQGWLFK
ncbi:hypothetical protein [Salipiger abyssi]|uniref:hypothetical protein n=1 Tax=Salipiger abyssi TaxID=1250539 RepID=UPI001A8E3146|nr:hypothetical protein [Salipiger abyssi]MBN9888286.1 hypothetical protein [Salipiger abyssi]